MALTQSAARHQGPSWDEEVVPALRKRLESESRTLSRRMSAISVVSSVEDLSAAFTKPTPIRNPLNDYRQPNNGSSSHQTPGPGYYYSTSVDHHPATTPSTSTRVAVNGVQSARKPVSTSFHRSRTYSQPYAVDSAAATATAIQSSSSSSSQMMMMNGSARPRPSAGKPKPTRIPKVSRTSNTPSSPPLHSVLNGITTAAIGGGVGGSSSSGSYFSPSYSTATNPSTPRYSADSRSPPPPNHNTNTNSYFPPVSNLNSSQVNLGGGGAPIQPHRIINEPAPFNTATSSNSSIYNVYQDADALGTRPARDSIDSTEEVRPFEHWYRGEVSRNGGVGELRVGKRQEMLEIANFGHAMSNKRKAVANRKAALLALEDANGGGGGRRGGVRKRADSIAGITMRDRGSLYLDEERAAQVGRVLDEDPLTDVEWEGSDIASVSTHQHHYHNAAAQYHSSMHHQHHRFSNHNADPDFIPGVGDVTSSTIAATATSTGFYGDTDDTPTTSFEDEQDSYARNYTPTQTARTTPTRGPKSRQDSSSSRIPTSSSDRRSSESRVSSATQHSLSKGQTPSPPPPPPPSSTTSPRSTTPSSMTKRGVSPGPNGAASPEPTKKARTAASPGPMTPQKKGVRPKPRSAMKKSREEEEKNRKSVARYPALGDENGGSGGGGDGDMDMDMADAIPSWTQPKPREGNWDDVVLPVVARKKGLEDFYEKADGSPRPKRKEPTPVAPAPGTFGYDDTKYRRGRSEDDSIEMDEFGRPKAPAEATTTTTTATAVDLTATLIPEEPEPELQEKAQKEDDEDESHHRPAPVSTTAHDNIRLPVGSPRPPISPPFSDYAPTTVQDVPYSATSVGGGAGKQGGPVVVEQDDKGAAGCCGCVVM